jgi:hypothetical protein
LKNAIHSSMPDSWRKIMCGASSNSTPRERKLSYEALMSSTRKYRTVSFPTFSTALRTCRVPSQSTNATSIERVEILQHQFVAVPPRPLDRYCSPCAKPVEGNPFSALLRRVRPRSFHGPPAHHATTAIRPRLFRESFDLRAHRVDHPPLGGRQLLWVPGTAANTHHKTVTPKSTIPSPGIFSLSGHELGTDEQRTLPIRVTLTVPLEDRPLANGPGTRGESTPRTRGWCLPWTLSPNLAVVCARSGRGAD